MNHYLIGLNVYLFLPGLLDLTYHATIILWDFKEGILIIRKLTTRKKDIDFSIITYDNKDKPYIYSFKTS